MTDYIIVTEYDAAILRMMRLNEPLSRELLAGARCRDGVTPPAGP
jgi:hypothetical protein